LFLGGARTRGGSTHRGRSGARKGARCRGGTVRGARSRARQAEKDGDLYADVGEQHLILIEIVLLKSASNFYLLRTG
jgi:hypothetical protein